MKTLIAFVKKEITEQIRSVKLIIITAVFVFFAVMNPTVAKLTPMLYELLADTMAQSGMTVTEVSVSAMDSWMQFFKNIPMGLIVFAILQSNIFTKEYRSGTLVLSLTKGLERYKVVISKGTVLAVLWTILYLLNFVVTYACNTIFWDNSVAQNLFFAAMCWWLFGIWVISLLTVFSTVVRSNIAVLCSTGGVVFALYTVGLLPKCGKFLPTFLADGNSLIYGTSEVYDYLPSLIIVIIVSIITFVISIPIFNKKQL